MWGKVLAGVAIGVGAVAAAPFTGGGSLLAGSTLAASLTGAGAIAAATGAGLTGAVVGGVMAETEDEERRADIDRGRAEGKAEGKAESSLEAEKLAEELVIALKSVKSVDNHFRTIIALEAVGVACAACDGDFSDEERVEIGAFVKGMLSQSIPENVKEKLQAVYDNPPTVKEAFLLAKESGLALGFYEDVIKVVMNVDGIKQEEREFVQAWAQLKAAA